MPKLSDKPPIGRIDDLETLLLLVISCDTVDEGIAKYSDEPKKPAAHEKSAAHDKGGKK